MQNNHIILLIFLSIKCSFTLKETDVYINIFEISSSEMYLFVEYHRLSNLGNDKPISDGWKFYISSYMWNNNKRE